MTPLLVDGSTRKSWPGVPTLTSNVLQLPSLPSNCCVGGTLYGAIASFVDIAVANAGIKRRLERSRGIRSCVESPNCRTLGYAAHMSMQSQSTTSKSTSRMCQKINFSRSGTELRGGPYRNKRNGDLGRFREESVSNHGSPRA